MSNMIEQIKKELYKQNPSATFVSAGKGKMIYKCLIKMVVNESITFSIPFEDIGDAVFTAQMDAKLLIRYIIYPK